MRSWERVSSVVTTWHASGSINRRIFNAASLIGGVTLAVGFATMLREQVIAAVFGTSDALDAYLVALLLPQISASIIAGGVSMALIPAYLQIVEQGGREAAQRLVSNLFIVSGVFFVLVAILLGLLAPWLLSFLASGFSPEKLALTQRLFYILLPLVVVNGTSAVLGAFLNARERFALVAFAPMLVPLIVVVVALGLGRQTSGIYALAIATVLGFVAQLALLTVILLRHGLSFRVRWYGIEPATRQTLGQFWPMIVGLVLSSTMALVDQAVASMLAPGSVAALTFGNRVLTLLTGLGAAALGTAALPYFSRMVAATDWAGLRHTLKVYSVLILAITIPITSVLFLTSDAIARLLFERGEFTRESTLIVAQVQAMFVLQLPFYTLFILYARVIASLRANHLLMWMALLNTMTNTALDLLLAPVLGVAGIALSSTLVSLLTLLVGTVLLARLLRHSEQKHGRQEHLDAVARHV